MKVLVGFILVLTLVFLAYSVAVNFSNWPWTKTVVYKSGEVMGFKIGAPKSSCFDQAIILQQRAEIRALGLVDAEPGTYEERFKGIDLTQDDFPAANLSNSWRLGLSGQNSWVLLFFKDCRLVRIEKKEYRGPTE